MDELYQYLTEIEVSQMTKIAVQTLRNDRFKRQRIPYHKIGRSIRYKLADVVRYMDSGRIETSSILGTLAAAKGGKT